MMLVCLLACELLNSSAVTWLTQSLSLSIKLVTLRKLKKHDKATATSVSATGKSTQQHCIKLIEPMLATSSMPMFLG